LQDYIVSKQPNTSDLTSSAESAEVLMERQAPKLFMYLVKRLFRSSTPHEDAKDLLQTIYLRYCASPGRELIRKPEPYLWKIAANALAEFRLRQDRDCVIYDSKKLNHLLRKQDEGDEHSAEWIEDPYREIASDQQLERVLRQIPPMYQAVLLLRTRDGLTLEEIAKKLGITTTTAKSYLYRAIAACQAADWNR
jgi:RNA polymerase sigma factor (sigma-70 family)